MFGKFFGSMMGFMTGGPFGAMFGLALGSSFDEHMQKFWKQSWSFSLGDSSQGRQVFLQAMMASLGKVAKSDGRITETDIAFAEIVMQRLHLNSGDKASAKRYFQQGKNDDFDVTPLLKELQNKCSFNPEYLGLFISILLQNCYQTGQASPLRLKKTKSLCKLAGLSDFQFEQIHTRFRQNWEQHSQRHSSHKITPQAAYKVLGVPPDSTLADVKKAYRRLMSQHHPDKHIASGHNQRFIDTAKEKTQTIQSAYDCIKKERLALAQI
ncbi:MAG: co-chaperone DjlA [Hahellaceae bacterium]|nr:co-chaperone DjlA [Hahellaceae bacterium]